jgi:Flp pilus assembly protein TadD
VSIWETVLARRPHPRAHANLAVALRDAGRDDDAIAQLRIAAPDDAESKHALGSALVERGEYGEAISLLESFVREHPRDREIASAREELALARRALLVNLLKAQRFGEAEAQSRALIALRANDAEAHNLLGVALASQDRIDDAINEFAEAVRLNPQYTEARNNLARASALRSVK